MSTIYQPPRHNLLTWPLIGAFLRWRWGRLVMQLLMLAAVLLLLYDGFTGPQLAPENLATVTVWVHYRGLIVFGFLLFGNLFCMGCPFTLPRTLAQKWAIQGRRWPRALRNKWVAIALLLFFFWLYEWADLWASPWLTAWIIVAYFAASFLLELVFSESPFCKYVCPLGTFNFVSATISPTQIRVVDTAVCQTCIGQECLNGRSSQPGQPVQRGSGNLLRANDIQVLGCGTELFAPQIKSNLDCIFCLDCARACPHDNVALALRPHLQETSQANWPARWDISLLVIIYAFASLGNAFGMVPPYFVLQTWLAQTLRTSNEAFLLLLIFGTLMFLLPVGLALLAGWLSRTAAQRTEPLRHTVSRYAPAFAPLGFAIWLAHYGGFHFLTSALTIVPVMQNFLLDHGVALFGAPDWTMAAVLPLAWLDGLELAVLLGGLLASLWVLGQRALLAPPDGDKPLAQLPWLLLLLGLAATAVWLFFLPMQMRGTIFVG
jgi:polyferredoxin